MNKARRRELTVLSNEINRAKTKDDIFICICTLEKIRDDEQDYFDNIPENLQYSQMAEDSEQSIEYMEEAIRALEESYDMNNLDKNLLEEAIDLIDDASL